MRSRAKLSASMRPAIAGRGGAVDLVGGDAQPRLVQVEPVEFPGQFDQRPVAARAHIGDDAAHRVFDVVRGLALGGEQLGKARGKIGGLAVEADRHRAVPVAR